MDILTSAANALKSVFLVDAEAVNAEAKSVKRRRKFTHATLAQTFILAFLRWSTERTGIEDGVLKGQALKKLVLREVQASSDNSARQRLDLHRESMIRTRNRHVQGPAEVVRAGANASMRIELQKSATTEPANFASRSTLID